MMKLNNSLTPKGKRRLEIATHIIGTASTIILIFFGFSMLFFSPKEVSTAEVRQELNKDSTEPPADVIVKGKVKKITEVPVYGYVYYVGNDIGILNYSKLPYKVGDVVEFKIVGVKKVLGDAYMVNADFQ